MPAIADLVHETSTSTGPGNFTLAAVDGKQRFSTAFSTGSTTNVFYYFISNRNAAEWEAGTGHMSAASTLVRDTVIASSNSNAAVSFTAGTKDVANDIPASIQERVSDGKFPLLGVNATADTTNRLSVAAPATLLNHDGNGHQLKLNKAAASDTASLLYQTGFSGRAEMGTTGDDDFHFKVSADGSTWKDAIVIDRSSGGVRLPNTGMREVLTANRTYYVRTDGNDSNTGLSNTSGGAFATIQKAIDTVAGLDLSVYDVLISVGAGTYTATNQLKRLTGAGTATIQGAGSSTVISVTGNNCFYGSGVTQWVLSNMKLTTTTSGNGIYLTGGGGASFSGIEFGAMPNGSYHMYAHGGSMIQAAGNYSITGGASAHMLTIWSGHIIVVGSTVTLTGTPAFGTAFAQCSRQGKIEANGNTYSGSATGARYLVDEQGLIFTNGGGANYFPGNSAGSAVGASFGRYS